MRIFTATKYGMTSGHWNWKINRVKIFSAVSFLTIVVARKKGQNVIQQFDLQGKNQLRPGNSFHYFFCGGILGKNIKYSDE